VIRPTKMAGAFPTFYGYEGENSREYLDNLEMAHLILGRDQEEIKLSIFPLVLKEEARVWYEFLVNDIKESLEPLQQAFINRFNNKEDPGIFGSNYNPYFRIPLFVM